MPNFKTQSKKEGENYIMLVVLDKLKEIIDRLNRILWDNDVDEDTCESIQSAIDDLEEAISTLADEEDEEEDEEDDEE